MKILALDLGRTTGWAHSHGPSGVWDLSVRRDESSGMRLVRFEGKLRGVQTALGIDVIAFETPTVARGKKANLDGLKLGTKLQAIIERLCEEAPGPECRGYNLQSIKAHALGRQRKGAKRDKEAMIEAAKRQWPDENILDDNHADALWLLDLVRNEFGDGQ